MQEDKKRNVKEIFKRIKEMKEASGLNKGYKTLLDTYYSDISVLNDASRISVPMKREIIDHIALVQKARIVLNDYLKMKPFILDIYVPQITQDAGIKELTDKEEVAKNIANEMEDALKSLTNLATRVSNETGSRLDKELAHNELKLLTEDLSYRIASYKRYHQSYLVNQDKNVEVLYQKQNIDA